MKPVWTAKRFWALLIGLGLLAYNQIKTKALDPELLGTGAAALAMFVFTWDGSQALVVKSGKKLRAAPPPPRSGARLTRD